MEGQNLIIMARAKPKVGAKDPIGHHYVSSFYLSRFADSAGVLHVHDKHSGKSFRTRPKEAMKQSHYYRQEWAPSGIDPNITPGSAYIQVKRISAVRNIPETKIKELVTSSIENTILGMPVVNVLKLNLKLDELK